ncbi:MAG: hypothetical protein ACYCYO_23370 [Bacilli bacterium]
MTWFGGFLISSLFFWGASSVHSLSGVWSGFGGMIVSIFMIMFISNRCFGYQRSFSEMPEMPAETDSSTDEQQQLAPDVFVATVFGSMLVAMLICSVLMGFYSVYQLPILKIIALAVMVLDIVLNFLLYVFRRNIPHAEDAPME